MTLATRSSIRPLIDSRPPVIEPRASAPRSVSPDQLPLDLWPEEPSVDVAPPGGSVRLVRGLWTVEPRADLPDAVSWSHTLAPAVLQAMLGQRPAAQLNRWLGESVSAEVIRRQRQRLVGEERVTLGVRVRSLRLAHPQCEAAEGAAVLLVGRRPVAVAFRLEARGQRWLCTAYELGRQPG